jgi:hypothetical protein
LLDGKPDIVLGSFIQQQKHYWSYMFGEGTLLINLSVLEGE